MKTTSMTIDGNRVASRGQGAQRAANAVPESDLQGQVEQLLALYGWTYYHTRDSRGSHHGFPDLIAIRRKSAVGRPRVRLLAAELKREGEQPTVEQKVWLELFASFSAESYCWRPSDLDEIAKVLR